MVWLLTVPCPRLFHNLTDWPGTCIHCTSSKYQLQPATISIFKLCPGDCSLEPTSPSYSCPPFRSGVRTLTLGERGGSVVECRTPEREVGGSKPTAAVLCPWSRHFTPRKYWLITQEAVAPSRHDWKIVDWDVKPQHNQPTTLTLHDLNHNTCFYVLISSVT